jgi:hypothetical protein
MIWVPGGWWIPFLLIAIFFWRPWRWGRRPVPPWDWDRHGRGRQPPRSPELDESVRARLDLVDQLETRVTELENRLDFAERLLAERREEKAISR